MGRGARRGVARAQGRLLPQAKFRLELASAAAGELAEREGRKPSTEPRRPPVLGMWVDWT